MPGIAIALEQRQNSLSSGRKPLQSCHPTHYGKPETKLRQDTVLSVPDGISVNSRHPDRDRNPLQS